MDGRHAVKWTPDLIAGFWRRYESVPGMELWHFSRQRGKALLRYVLKQRALDGPILDLGCGSGHLLDLLVLRGFTCFGADINSKAIELLNKRLSGRKGFLGARVMEFEWKIPFTDDSVGTVFLVETIEHLLPDSTEPLFSEIRRVLKNEGLLVVTSPYRENLNLSMAECKKCGAVFHNTQHLRSLGEKTLVEMVKKAGLRHVSCAGPLLVPDLWVWIRAQQVPKRVTIPCPECGEPCSNPNSNLRRRFKSLLAELRHLVCIAEKK